MSTYASVCVCYIGGFGELVVNCYSSVGIQSAVHYNYLYMFNMFNRLNSIHKCDRKRYRLNGYIDIYSNLSLSVVMHSLRRAVKKTGVRVNESYWTT